MMRDFSSVKWLVLAALLVTLAGLLGCDDDENISPVEVAERQDLLIRRYLEENGIRNYTRIPSGIYYHVLEPGNGEAVPNNTVVTVHYDGRILYGKRFDSSYLRDEPFIFQIPSGQIVEGFDEEGNAVFANSGVIEGWIEAVGLMEKAEKTRFYLPSSVAYGERGSGDIPGNTIIYFDIEVLDFTTQ